MIREDLIDGAVTFLQDPSVASAPIEQKLSFLRSKNLTQEEVDASLARAGQSQGGQSPPQSQPANYPRQQYQQQQPQYGGYQQYPPNWNQPPEPPRRDWRDWFIMATVMGGVSYAMYWTARRYIYPLIAPPTPPQLEQDKASIDASFDKAFALLDQLATDTQELKDSEKERKERLDHALAEVEGVISKMKEANENRELEAKRMARELEDIKEQIPQAIQKEKEATDGRLKDLAVEMKSLKTLVGNRMGGQQPPQRPSFSGQAPNGVNGTNGAPTPTQVPVPTQASVVQAPEANGTNAPVDEAEKPASALPERSPATGPYGRILGGKAQIPGWQLAAKKRSEDAAKNEVANGTNGTAAQNVSESGTATESEASG